MNDHSDGLLIGVAEASPSAHERTVFIQSNHGVFYRQRHGEPYPGQHRAWRDFYYAAAYVSLGEIEARWGSKDVVLQDVTSGGWNLDAMTATLEALGRRLDHVDRPPPALKRLHITQAKALRESLRHFKESPHLAQGTHRDLDVHSMELAQIGCSEVDGVDLLRVSLPSRATAKLDGESLSS